MQSSLNDRSCVKRVDCNERRNLVKFRVSNHKLMIELGRYQTDHMPRETRLCPLCKSNQVENETHFLLQM